VGLITSLGSVKNKKFQNIGNFIKPIIASNRALHRKRQPAAKNHAAGFPFPRGASAGKPYN
jgi:hypothetical protein